MKAIFAAMVMFLLSAGVASACPVCPDGMTQVNVPTPWGYYGYGMDKIGVVGYGCNYYWPNEISTWVWMSGATETYDVYGYVIRGNPYQCQANEDFTLTIAGITGPETQDDADACASSERLEFLGTFPLNHGWNQIKMTSVAHCPPDTTANSVELYKLCVVPEPPPAPEFPLVQTAPLLAGASLLLAYGVIRKKS